MAASIYDIHQATHPADRKRGGSAILIRSCLQCYQFYSLQSPNVQCVAVKVKTDLAEIGIDWYRYIDIYCPPNFQCSAADYEKLFDDLETTPTAIDFAVCRGIRPESLSISECLELSSDHIPLIVKLRVAAQKASRRLCILPRYASLPRFQEAVNWLVNFNMVLSSPDAINNAVELFVQKIHIAATSGSFKTWCYGSGNFFSFCRRTWKALLDIWTRDPRGCWENTRLLDASSQDALPIQHISPEEVILYIQKLHPRKAPGFDGIDSRISKAFPKKGILFLVPLFNSMLRIHHFPSQRKCAVITRKNAIVEYLDYQIPVTQLKGPKGNRDSSKARLKCATYRR